MPRWKISVSLTLWFCFFLQACAGSRGDVHSSLAAVTDHEPVIRVKVSGRRPQILEIPLDTYLSGVIGHEMSPRWPLEALKAQTVAARSYALYRLNKARATGRSYDVVDSQADQVFRVVGTKNAYLQDIVNQTRGEVLWNKGHVVQAFYSSTCGGKTETAVGADLGDCDLSPLKKYQKDSFCHISPFYTWIFSMSAPELTKKLSHYGAPITDLRSLKISEKNPSGYAKTIEYQSGDEKYRMSAKAFRSLMGSMKLKSLLFEIYYDETGMVTFNGHGFGHGVGLCQYGAKQMALERKNYKKILAHYYPKIAIKKIY